MNLKPLFDKQRELKDRIEKEHPVKPGENRFNKKVLALLVEVGECANDWRGFKFWSANQNSKDSLLEEYVDGLHFVLELGIEWGVDDDFDYKAEKYESVISQFVWVQNTITGLYDSESGAGCMLLIAEYLGLGEMLGFTPEQITGAYMDKNKVNHERQDNGY